MAITDGDYDAADMGVNAVQAEIFGKIIEIVPLVFCPSMENT